MTVRTRLAVGLAAVGLVLTGCGAGSPGTSASATSSTHDHSGGVAPATVSGAKAKYAGLNLSEPYRRPTFTLTDTAGAPYDFTSATTHRPTLLFFGYTRCPDVCPTTMADIAVALRTLDRSVAEQVQVVFVTTDPAYDKPAALREYLDRFDADLPHHFIGLTGKQDVIDQAQLSAGVPLAEEDGRLHSSLLLLYGKDDEAHVAFDAGNTFRDIASDLRAVVAAS